MLVHDGREAERERDRRTAGDEEGQPEVDQGQGYRRPDAEQAGDAGDLGAALVRRAEPFRSELVGEPRVLGAAAERPREAPQRHAGDDPTDVRQGADADHGQAGQERAGHDGGLAGVRVGDDAGGDLEQEVGDLERGPREDELER